MMSKDDFFKFPSTCHLATLPGVDIRSDKVLSKSERDEFVLHELIIEEKIDGANLGISFDANGNIRAQNRGMYMPLLGSGQWKKIGDWLAPRTDALFEHISDHFILFGEWCYAQHSVFYDRLPDWFLGFDIYDKQAGQFLSSTRRDALLREMHIAAAPVVARGHFAYAEIPAFLSTSKFGDQPAEGLYLRFDRGDWLAQRAKLIRPEFIRSVEQHWSRTAIKPNRLRPDVQGCM